MLLSVLTYKTKLSSAASCAIRVTRIWEVLQKELSCPLFLADCISITAACPDRLGGEHSNVRLNLIHLSTYLASLSFNTAIIHGALSHFLCPLLSVHVAMKMNSQHEAGSVDSIYLGH